MNESEFLAVAVAVLDAIEVQVDRWYDEQDIDIEGERNGNVLTLSFEDRSQVVINTQAPMQEIWVASRSGGFHYRLQEDGSWFDSRNNKELADALSEIISEQANTGLRVSLS
ncbi:iron donor protein CyaY [Pigmentiphaga aceris]|uniref:Iron-sulfur cluster assembly protein CyaY n=1 Tax=Pigmentiphaga aceris TaxID=1940612 RepID=A0A5C0B366_9BURK|nr:iron donor protein CyaY [Pigmentiphaga aceris]QEI08705.1 iron donor protein CyaY [Pigmentiphaga aceris]